MSFALFQLFVDMGSELTNASYQPGGSSGFNPGSGIDPLSNGTLCLRDAALMQQLGVNTIRIYNLDPDLNHDMCASIFNGVGIYMLIDVNSPLADQSLDPGDLTGSYSLTYLNHTFAVVEAFKNYPNTLGFFGANEVMNTVGTGTTAPPYLRAVTRDLKNYIAKNSPRQIPVGYSAADVSQILTDSWAYLSCDINGNSNDPSRSDFFGLNSYSWCGPTSLTANYDASGYNTLISTFGNTSIPVFFSEYGCNKVEPRVFDEVPVLYGNMTSVLSGGLVYEYYQESSNNYGLVAFYSNGTAQLLIDYENLQKQFNTLDVKALESMNSSATAIKSPECSSSLISSSGFNNSFTLPAAPSGVQQLIDSGVKNANQGKLVTVTDTAVTLPVYSVSGSLINNLAIKLLPNDESNAPNGATTGGTSTSSGASPSSTKKGAAGKIQAGLCGSAGIAILLAFLLL